jgi:REP-associated tyrosine transposase
MFLTPFTSLTWAYQLHYYLGFRTHSRHPVFAGTTIPEALTSALREICERHDYHLLTHRVYPAQLRTSLSLRPQHSVAKVVQSIKANTARVCGAEFSLATPVWARGYLALSTGSIRIATVRQYLDSQATHHGYATRILPPVFRYCAEQPVALATAHSRFELNYHLVFATWERRGVFTSALGQALVEYWLRVADKRGFAIDRASVVPDHAHLMVRLLPQMTIDSCGLSLLNNSQHFMAERFPQILIQAAVPQLWQASAYAGTCGETTTALVKAWLRG